MCASNGRGVPTVYVSGTYMAVQRTSGPENGKEHVLLINIKCENYQPE